MNQAISGILHCVGHSLLFALGLACIGSVAYVIAILVHELQRRGYRVEAVLLGVASMVLLVSDLFRYLMLVWADIALTVTA